MTIDWKKKEDSDHYMRCPGCEDWFDMRDLEQVMEHEHWLVVKPVIQFSHVKKIGNQAETFIKVNSKMVTLKFAGKQPK